MFGSRNANVLIKPQSLSHSLSFSISMYLSYFGVHISPCSCGSPWHSFRLIFSQLHNLQEGAGAIMAYGHSTCAFAQQGIESEGDSQAHCAQSRFVYELQHCFLEADRKYLVLTKSEQHNNFPKKKQSILWKGPLCI